MRAVREIGERPVGVEELRLPASLERALVWRGVELCRISDLDLLHATEIEIDWNEVRRTIPPPSPRAEDGALSRPDPKDAP